MKRLDVVGTTGGKATVETTVAPSPDQPPEVRLCGKCKRNPRRKDHAYCSECLRAWAAGRRASEPARHFARGAEAMRRRAIEAFTDMGQMEINGYTAAEVMRAVTVEG